jgi:ornithine carbamoyltransferase
MKDINHFLSITDLTEKEIYKVFKLGLKLKAEIKNKGKNKEYFKNKTLAMVFEKPSLRTRVSFEAGMTQLGGHAIYLAPADIGLGKREAVSDVAKVISSMADLIMARTFKQQTVEELAKYSSVPVINGLSDLEHPCQIMADLLTVWEIKDKLKGLTLAFVGDGDNNVTHSLCLAAGLLGFNFHCASPKGYAMKKEIVAKAKKLGQQSGVKIMATTDPVKAVVGVDVVYTDTWTSMGDEAEKEKRSAIFKSYQVTAKLMQLAKKEAIFMHDLPAYRGNEVVSAVIDGKQSVVFQQAENRLHAQKALMLFLLKEDL